MKAEEYIGKKCKKSRIRGATPKPFKSGSSVNTIKGIIINPHTSKDAFIFEEDDSCVNCDTIIIID